MNQVRLMKFSPDIKIESSYTPVKKYFRFIVWKTVFRKWEETSMTSLTELHKLLLQQMTIDS